MGDLRALRTKDITPAIVINGLKKAEEDGKVDSIYVVTIKNGKTQIWASGDLNMLGLAHVAFTDFVMKSINDEIVEER
jgi:hypothetical protein